MLVYQRVSTMKWCLLDREKDSKTRSPDFETIWPVLCDVWKNWRKCFYLRPSMRMAKKTGSIIIFHSSDFPQHCSFAGSVARGSIRSIQPTITCEWEHLPAPRDGVETIGKISTARLKSTGWTGLRKSEKFPISKTGEKKKKHRFQKFHPTLRSNIPDW